jgi:hypothetical protein
MYNCISNVLYNENIIFIVVISCKRSFIFHKCVYIYITFMYSVVCKVHLYFIAYVKS